MGNLCGKESSDNLAAPNRAAKDTQASRTPYPHATIPGPKTASQVKGPGRTIGSVSGDAPTGAAIEDPRAAAARAAEERASKLQAQSRGKLAERLAMQKKQTRADTLEQVSNETRGARTADENAANRSWN